MIKLFRNIRQKLLSENKTTSYLKYALGEIVLVVIGILIALQINNWNEAQKHAKSRVNYTKSLISDLEKDSIQLIVENQNLTGRLNALAKVKKRLSSPLATLDTLNHIIRYEHDPSFVTNEPINKNTFASLTSTGNIEFFDQSLAEAIQNYYQNASFVEGFHESQLTFYKNMFTQYLATVPLAGTARGRASKIIVQDKLEDALWQEADLPKIHSIYRGQCSMQLNLFAAFKRLNNNLIKVNHELSQQLKNSL
ncbi:DUF6090 family protein [Gaetbulibacter aestuarii]|uniref:DUF6090 family protein n=1 Tax=Gaetbulibacter aestuarii TaxID=1502358 RepID=A0ABW7MVK3_9FLAO